MKRKVSAIILCCILASARGQDLNRIIQEFNPTQKLLQAKKLSNQENTINFYFSSFSTNDWNYTYKRNSMYCYIFMEENNNFESDFCLSLNKEFNELENKLKHNDTIYTTSFFSSYDNSNFNKQLDSYKIKDCLTYIVDLDNDGNDEILNFGDVDINVPKGLIIMKYVNNYWRCVFSESYFGFYDWNDGYFLEGRPNESAFDDEWFTPKPFPYDFVEYKGKTGLRIVCHDQPKNNPSHYHAQFWAYDENTQKYEMKEEIWEEKESTPPDGLIFAKAKEGLFSK